jgi:hypothetical protein
MNEGDRWLLHDVLVVDQASGDRGTIVARLFDCPPGTSAAGPAGSCDLMPELAFQYELVSADGKMRKGIGDATFATRGVLEWSDLPAGTYLIRVLGASSVGVSLVMAGGRPTSDGQFEVRLPVGGKRAVIDIYHQWRFYSDLLRRISGSADNTISCPPCNTMDPVSGICTPNCAPCSKCRSVDIGNGAKISSCVGSCPDSTICVENRCCADIGVSCQSKADCCNNNCVAGTCDCSKEGESCQQSTCCAGNKCDRDSKSCAACGARDAVCSNDDDCCEGQCFDGHCRCCAIFAVLATDKDWGVCCEYPQVSVVVGDSQYGPEFGRCCTPGIDCPGDPKGPPKVGLDFGLGYWTC